MKCGKCGKIVDDDSMFCEHCGAELESIVKTVSDTSRKWRSISYLLVSVLVAVVAWNVNMYSKYSNADYSVVGMEIDSTAYEQVQLLTAELEETKSRAERLDSVLKQNARIVRDTVVVERERIVEKTVPNKANDRVQAENQRLQNEVNSSKNTINSLNATINSNKNQINDLNNQIAKLNKLLDKYINN